MPFPQGLRLGLCTLSGAHQEYYTPLSWTREDQFSESPDPAGRMDALLACPFPVITQPPYSDDRTYEYPFSRVEVY